MDVLRLGTVGYKEAWSLQQRLVDKRIAGEIPDTLVLLQHPPVLTLGANFHAENLLRPVSEFEGDGVEVINTDRGGDVTYHGPGQLVGYPIVDVSARGQDLHRWLRDIELTIIETLGNFGIYARQFPPHTGAWVGDRKIAAIGIKVRKWVSMHGFALNVDMDMKVFRQIVPCGISSYGLTTMAAELERPVSMAEVADQVEEAFQGLLHPMALS